VIGERKLKVGADCWINDRSSRPTRPCCKISCRRYRDKVVIVARECRHLFVLSLDADAEAGCGASRKLLTADFEAVVVLTLLRLACKRRK
jgi:hypothetical protein